MQTSSAKKRARAGAIISALPVLFLLADAVAKFFQPEPVVTASAALGFPPDTLFALGSLEAACAVLFAVPRTAVLGAVLLTGYLGGATAVHVVHGSSFGFTIGFGVIVWLGMLLRDERLLALFPLRHPRPR
ncbi:DoxX family protein [Nannocystis sp. ILAH1]|uniref:DoxX family protein n=1 Tax=unclassified Nannocystis TaxID=2627009 RepID=UPI00226DEB32|nr:MULTISPECIES: DoxX family protein [unclassified Nannocystis]MCY0991995.1 DoxX family protein [Nannocystis sp. ILAH1]MCY1064244.1 DoxX family protein [Nannocystis sp. RBIL2]